MPKHRPNTTKRDLVKAASEASGVSQKDSMEVVNGFLLEIIATTAAGRTAELRGFGTFAAKLRKPRPARNPKTGEVVQIPAKRVLTFNASPELKKTVTA